MQAQIREYRILSKIGEGGMGVVYKAEDTNLNRLVVIKAIHTTLTSSSEIVDRFKNEARLQATLTHPNIISLYNLFVENGVYYMVMEYAEGETLRQRITRVGLLPPHKCIPMFIQMLDAVGYAHNKGIIHRDIKPSNIFICANDQIKILDFGVAKLTGDKGLTKTGSKLGTISYMSPEQVIASKNVDKLADIYSLGITFFEMLTGQLPYSADTDSDYLIMEQIVKAKIPSVKKYYPYVPDNVDLAIAKATQKEKENRFQSCYEFKQFIEDEEIDVSIAAQKREITFSGVVPPKQKPLPQPFAQHKSNFDFNNGMNEISIEKVFAKASFGKRVGANFIDAFIFVILIVLSYAITNASSDPDHNGGFIILIIIIWIIFLIKDGLRQGRGLGKGMVGLRIINFNKKEIIGIGKGFARNLVNGIIYGISYIVPYAGPIILLIIDISLSISEKYKGRRMVDLILGTMVVGDESINIDAYGNVLPL